MSTSGAKTLVLLTGLLMVVFVAIEEMRGTAQGSTYKKVWAIGLLTLGLGVAADFIPELVGPFAGLVLIAAYARNQGAIGGIIAKTPAAASAAGGTAPGVTKTGAANPLYTPTPPGGWG